MNKLKILLPLLLILLHLLPQFTLNSEICVVGLSVFYFQFL